MARDDTARDRVYEILRAAGDSGVTDQDLFHVGIVEPHLTAHLESLRAEGHHIARTLARNGDEAVRRYILSEDAWA